MTFRNELELHWQAFPAYSEKCKVRVIFTLKADVKPQWKGYERVIVMQFAYAEKCTSVVWKFVNYERKKFYNIGTRSLYIIKHHESVIYGKMTNFMVSDHILAVTTKTLAYHEVCKLLICNFFVVQAQGQDPRPKMHCFFKSYLLLSFGPTTLFEKQ